MCDKNDFINGLRIAFVIGLFSYALWAVALVVATQDLNLKLAFLGLGFAALGTALGLVSSMKTDKEIEELKNSFKKINSILSFISRRQFLHLWPDLRHLVDPPLVKKALLHPH